MKKCPKCNTEKEFSDFTKDKNTLSGYSCLCKPCKNSYKRNAQQAREYYLKTKEWYLKNRVKTRIWVNEYEKNKRKTDPLFAIKCALKSRVNIAFKRKSWHKDSHNSELLGVDLETAKKHIERQFKKGMSWGNHGMFGWHIDHIIPLASAKISEELKLLCHYTNLQPLWRVENIIKSDNILPTQLKIAI